jgi:serine/threonine protein phosphatase 1
MIELVFANLKFKTLLTLCRSFVRDAQKKDRQMITTPRHTLPLNIPTGTAVMVVGDVHGQADALERLLTHFGKITTPGLKRHLVFLGDLIDRGPDSRRCLDLALNRSADLARADDVTLLPGNHELMLRDAFLSVHSPDDAKLAKGGQSWMLNGGIAFLEQTIGQLGGDPKDMLARFEATLPLSQSFVDMVDSWPSHITFGDTVLVHAGVRPDVSIEESVAPSHGEHIGDNTHWAWIRDAFLLWDNGFTFQDGRSAFVVHGHSIPLPARNPDNMQDPDNLWNILAKPQYNRLCLDAGAAKSSGVGGAVLVENAARVVFSPC